jgi:soluble lytic murein transglycosylase-like protein
MKVKIITVATLVVIAFGILTLNKKCNSLNSDPYLKNVDTTEIVNSSPSIQMYFFIKKYAEKYDIPESYAFSLAYQETRYQGPLDLKYNHKQKSYAGALGPMQIMPATAKMIHGKSISARKLSSDIALNVEISMKLLRRLHNKHKNWGLVFGAYNTGRPCINQYAKNILNKQYNWVS